MIGRPCRATKAFDRRERIRDREGRDRRAPGEVRIAHLVFGLAALDGRGVTVERKAQDLGGAHGRPKR